MTTTTATANKNMATKINEADTPLDFQPSKRQKSAQGPQVEVGNDDFFPVDLSKYQNLSIDPWTMEKLTPELKTKMAENVQLCRDALVFFTACGAASGYGGHTGGAYDIQPEICFLDAFFNACPEKFKPILFDEAGHRVAAQYLFSALKGHLKPAQLKQYRVGHAKLPGHPELGHTPGVAFSSGRLGHTWPMVNGVAMEAAPKVTVMLGSDGSQMEGDDAEAARLAVAQNLPVKLFLDDNDVTIAGHPSQYLKGFDLAKTLEGHGMPCEVCDPEDLDQLYAAMRKVVCRDGPGAVICRRKMASGLKELEGRCDAHDVISVANAIAYLERRGLYAKGVEYLKTVKKSADPHGKYEGAGALDANRQVFGSAVVKCLKDMTEEERVARVRVIDSDLEGSCGLKKIRESCPEVYVKSGVMERGNFSACAGFGFTEKKQGIFATFAAFLEMCCSEITMARLNKCNVLCHFSHSGVDDMADNTCHYGLNNFFADNGLEDEEVHHPTSLYFPADAHQMSKCVQSVFYSPGMRFIFSTRSKLPEILDEDGKPLYGDGYSFVPGKDDVVRSGTAGYIVSFGDALYRCLDAVTKLRKEGVDVGLINKSTLNTVDEDTMRKIGSSPFVLVVEPLNEKTGLGMRFGTWLLERGLTPKYAKIGTKKEGCGGLWEHAYHQGYDSDSVANKVRKIQASLKKQLGAVGA